MWHRRAETVVIYTPDRDPEDAAAAMEKIFDTLPPKALEWTARHTGYNAEMRFTLSKVDQRIFTAERYCHRGSIDDWIRIDGPAPIEPLAQMLVQHLGRDSLYELF